MKRQDSCSGDGKLTEDEEALTGNVKMAIYLKYMKVWSLINIVKGTVGVILSVPLCKVCYARFTTVPLTTLYDQV